MKLVITESQSERLTEQLKDWVGKKLTSGGEKILKSKGGKKATEYVGDAMQKQAMTNLEKGMKFSPETMKDFEIDFEKDAPTLSKFMSRLSSIRGDATTKAKSPLLPQADGEPAHPSPGGTADYTPPKTKKKKADKISYVRVPKNLSVKQLGRYMMHPLGTKSRITSKYGKRIHPIHKEERMHSGIDLSADSGSPVYSPLDGVVTRSEDTSPDPCGGHIRIDHGKLQTKFCHLSNMVVAKGASVKRGQVIGYTGGGENDPMRGLATAAHLHYEILDSDNKALNPVLIEPNLI